MQEIILKIRYFVSGLSKNLKKLTLFLFQTLSLSMGKIIKNKSGLELVNIRSSRYEATSGKFLY